MENKSRRRGNTESPHRVSSAAKCRTGNSVSPGGSIEGCVSLLNLTKATGRFWQNWRNLPQLFRESENPGRQLAGIPPSARSEPDNRHHPTDRHDSNGKHNPLESNSRKSPQNCRIRKAERIQGRFFSKPSNLWRNAGCVCSHYLPFSPLPLTR